MELIHLKLSQSGKKNLWRRSINELIWIRCSIWWLISWWSWSNESVRKLWFIAHEWKCWAMSNSFSRNEIWFTRIFVEKIKQQNQSLSSELIIVDLIKDFLLGLIIEQIPNEKIPSFSTVEVNFNRQALKTCLEHLSTHQFPWLQFYLSSNDDDHSMMKITKYLKKLYEELREDLIVNWIFNGQDQFSRCFIRFRDQEKFLQLIIDGRDHSHDLQLIKI